MRKECPCCGEKYKNVAMHWSRSSDCSPPPLSQKQKDIITGLVMGDGSVVVSHGNPSLHVKMINEKFLSWLDGELGWISNGYTHTQTAEEAASQNRESGFSPNAKAENYHDKYTLRTMCREELWEWREWYDDSKTFPDDLNLSPILLKVWYCCDGSKATYNEDPHISISCLNEEENIDKLIDMFAGIGVEPVPHKSKRSFALRFNQSDSNTLWRYMGEPVPGFEDKWP